MARFPIISLSPPTPSLPPQLKNSQRYRTQSEHRIVMQINLQADSNKQEKHPQWDSVFSVVEGKPKALPETAANGKFVSEEGQEWTKTVVSA